MFPHFLRVHVARRLLLIVALAASAFVTAFATGVTPAHATSIAPVLTKSFDHPLVAMTGGVTRLTFNLSNPDPSNALLNLQFSDTLPAGMTVNNPNGILVDAACDQVGFTSTITALAGTNVISLTDPYLGIGTNCTFSVEILVNVSAITVFTNTTSSVTSQDAPDGNPATAKITAIAPPTFTKFFGAPTIPIGGTTGLTFEMSNPNPAGATPPNALDDVAFTDPLPPGLIVATPADALLTCNGGSDGLVLAQSGSSSISFQGGTLNPQSACFLTVNVTGTAAGMQTNSTSQLVAGFGPIPNSDTPWGNAVAGITVAQPPIIAKAFGADSIPLNGTTSLTFTITDPNTTVAVTNVKFSDTLPAGLVVATPSGASGACAAGTFTANAGSNTISLTGGMIGGAAPCVLTVNVTGTAYGIKQNSVQATSDEGASNVATATLVVAQPPSIQKSFGGTAITPGGTTGLTFTINNTNTTVALDGVAFTDALPAGLVVASPSQVSGSCGGGTIAAVAGTSTISLSNATLPPSSSCSFTVIVAATASTGLKTNSVTVTSTNGSIGNTATASINVAYPANISKGFALAAVPVQSPVKLTFRIDNPNSVALNGVGFTDVMPLGLLVANPSRLAGSCGGGTIAAVPGTNAVSLSGATLAANTTCTFSVYVIGTSFGWKHNVTSPVTAANAPAGNVALASILI
jgi:uncharacterized repeat protein (TIGR01451 family)